MAATLTPAVRASRPSWNPLRCGGTGLPPNLLIMLLAGVVVGALGGIAFAYAAGRSKRMSVETAA